MPAAFASLDGCGTNGHGSRQMLALLTTRRFGPLFATQFLGAFNDNLFRTALVFIVAYYVAAADPKQAALLASTAAGLFIAPFFLFSGIAGSVADARDKAGITRLVKLSEIAFMALGWAALAIGSLPLALAVVFLMGCHSTIFGPVKYAILPQHLKPQELLAGTGLVEGATFVAILLGNVAGGLLVAWPGDGPAYVAVACLALALAGRLAAQFIPEAPANDPALTINWNPLSETWRNLRHAKADPKVFLALIGISWMWFFGAVFLSQFPSFAKEILHGNAQVASLLLVVFSVGIAIGSLLCEVLGRRQVELGLVPLGAMGMTLFTLDLYFASRALPPSALMDAAAFLQHAAHWRVMADLGLLSLSAGLYSVPLYALIQLRTAASHRARIIAANNILNALFMIASALLAGVLLTAGLDMAQVFLCVGLGNALVTLYLFVQEPDYGKRMKALLLRWTVWS